MERVQDGDLERENAVLGEAGIPRLDAEHRRWERSNNNKLYFIVFCLSLIHKFNLLIKMLPICCPKLDGAKKYRRSYKRKHRRYRSYKSRVAQENVEISTRIGS